MSASASVPASWRSDVLRGVLVLAVSSALGLAANGLARRPVNVLSAKGPGALPAQAPRISAADYASAVASGRALLLIDVRSAETYARGHSPQSVNVPWDDFVAVYNRLGLASLLDVADGAVLLCDSAQCPAADRAAETLVALGHPRVQVFEGGWEGYRAAGLPIKEARP